MGTKKPEITLKAAKADLPTKKTTFRASDLPNQEKIKALREKAKKSAKTAKKRKYDEIDAYCAEILARFGYEVYQKWNNGEIREEQMAKWVYAERARDKVNILNLEAIIMAMVGSCIRRGKKDPKPKGPGIAQKIYNEEVKTAKGEN